LQALNAESASDRDYADEHRHTNLAALAHLSNLDKHRRLAVTAWWPGLVYWMSDGESNRRWEPGDGTFEDGSIIGYVTGTDEGHTDVVHEFNLTLPDLPWWKDQRTDRDDVVKLAKAWVFQTRTAVAYVLQVWTVADKS
jgi:hypothetical protein